MHDPDCPTSTATDRDAPASPMDTPLEGHHGRVIAWFSCGGPSTVAAKLAIADHGPDKVMVVRIDTGSEHPDQERFHAEAERWLDHEIITLRSEDYADTWDVWERTRYLVGPKGARCTVELKRKVRYAFQRPTDLHVFGYTSEETSRVERFHQSDPGLAISCPLIDRDLSRSDCLAMIERAGIELPVMYRLGFRNNNCIGCPKAGIGYWNHVRRHFPDTFDRMALLERDIGHAVLSEEITPGTRRKTPVWLDELDPDRGDVLTEQPHDCSLVCADVEVQLSTTTSGSGVDGFGGLS